MALTQLNLNTFVTLSTDRGKSAKGAIPNSSTTMALISMLHSWSLGTDRNGATVRTLLLDYRKAFDFIDHSILVRKLESLR